MSQDLPIRPADPADLPALQRIWTNGWHEGHAAVVPQALVNIRTPDAFLARLTRHLGDTRVAGPVGAPKGFHILENEQLYQFYVAPAGRSQGLPALLLADAEACLHAAGHATAWLACAVGNDRAARFYEKHGWQRMREEEIAVHGAEPVSGAEAKPFPLTVWIYEKQLR